jgi:phosphoribosylaminoimidazolecarboxamide formyltransferase/IMP cyclohydrolase
MELKKKVQTALISVYHKEGLEELLRLLHRQGVQLYSTGGTCHYIESLGLPVHKIEDLTGYPSILGGRVKTLHPKVFGGILARTHLDDDRQDLQTHDIPTFDMVVVDLYPFEATVASAASETDIIEKIDIGGISLIRAAAKNFREVVIVPSRAQYEAVYRLLLEQDGHTTLIQRKQLATIAFDISSHYDTAIFNYFNNDTHSSESLKVSIRESQALRYGENPHQKGFFHGKLDDMLEQLHGKEISYNNLIDIDAAIQLAADFAQDLRPFFAILKHNNACGAAYAHTVANAYERALAGDPVSAFGGVLISTLPIDLAAAEKINELFVEVLIAPDFDKNALQLLKSKKNRILLRQKHQVLPQWQIRTVLNGIIRQERDSKVETAQELKTVTKWQPTEAEIKDLLFANKLVKHTKSNAIVLAKDEQLLASGTGQTSRVDALKQAIAKAKHFGFDLQGAVMASDAFFPFPDCVEIAHQAGIRAVIQPGGSVRDQESIDFCDAHEMKMVFTGYRHFKH